MTDAEIRRRGLVTLAVLTFAWGVNWPAMKIVFTEFPPLTFRAGSCLLAGIVLMAIAASSSARLAPGRGEIGPLFVCAVLNVTGWQIGAAMALLSMPSGQAAVLGFTMPIWAALISVGLGERLSARVALATALGGLGVAALLWRDLFETTFPLAAVGWMLLAAIGWACGALYQKRRTWTLAPLAMTAWQVMLGTPPIVLAMALFEPIAWPLVSTLAWICGLFVTFVSVVGGYYFWFRLVTILPTHIAALGTLTTPIVAMATGALTIGEAFGWPEAVAILCVTTALALVLIVPAMRQAK